MGIRSVQMRRFCSVGSSGLEECGELNVLIGKNNAGKSNALGAIELRRQNRPPRYQHELFWIAEKSDTRETVLTRKRHSLGNAYHMVEEIRHQKLGGLLSKEPPAQDALAK